MSDPDCVQVAVRIRPLVQSEYDRGCKTIIEKTPNEPQIIINSFGKSNDRYTFNHVFSPEHQQDCIYSESVRHLLDKLFEGYNVTILAYGQTGSGKTHTMGTTFEGMFDDTMGVIPRAMDDIFKQIEIMKDKEIIVKCSFMELYQEQLYDLLSDGSREESIVEIREDNKGIIIPDLTEVRVISPLQTTNCLIRGSSLRAVGATAMNSQSSRSHAVFTITLEMRPIDEPNNLTAARFHLVDLAGSERSKKTKATGKRFREGVEINKGLLALGNVISALGSGTQSYISYRDSKLTRLLQDSLGGNSVTLMIACVSPADYNVEETLSTLRYADRARKIKNKPIINQDPQTAEINKLNQMIQKLRLDLIDKKGVDYETNYDSKISSNEITKWKIELNSVSEKNRMLQSQLQVALDDVVNIQMRAVLAETDNEKLQTKLIDLKKSILDLNASFNQETCPVEFLIHAKALEEIHLKIDDIDNIFIKNKEDITAFNMSTNNLLETSLTSNDSINNKTNDDEQLETITSKQIGFSNELRNLNKELALKEELHQKFIGNLSNFCSYENEINPVDKINEYKTIIVGLEKERDDLNDKLKSAKANVISVKIAEERKKKLELLELKIADFKKKNEQQEKLLKLREKDSLRIDNLNKDIQEMKSCKVKLIRAMKNESDNFRLWKTNRDRELCQLKEKERKRQNEIVKMNCLHLKQQNVLKRKVEEALASSKRLKTVIEKQEKAQMHRKGNKNSSKMENVTVRLGHEIDIILSVLEAKKSLEYIVEDRASINQRINALKLSSTSNDAAELESLEANLLTRNGQINELHEKIVATNIEEKIKTICDNINHIPDAQTSLKNIFNILVELKTEISIKTEKYEAIETEYEKQKVLSEKLEKNKNDDNLLFMVELNDVEKKYEEKILILWLELNKTNEENSEKKEGMHKKMHEETLTRYETFKEQFEILQNENDELKAKLNEIRLLKKISNRRNKTVNYSNISSDMFSEFEEEDDEEKDPDWRNTPLQVRNSRSNQTLVNHNGTNRSLKRKSDIIKCNCKAKCCTKSCSCKKNNIICSEICNCTILCENKPKDEKENTGEFSTPKKNRTSDNLMDVTTPSYPYSDNKPKQFYNY